MSDASSAPGASIRELLLGMGSSSMRKSYYPELRSKLDDLELFRELVDRSSDGILLFSLPENRLLFGNIAAREAFGIDEEKGGGKRIEEVLSSAVQAGYPACLDRDDGEVELGAGCSVFIQVGKGPGGERRYEIVVNEVVIAGKRYAIAVARDSTDRLIMEERIRRDLVEKETMLREIHHRVKNNFQLMKSLLSLEASTIEDEGARMPLVEAENRIMSMAGAHEKLYESPNLSSVDAKAYFEDIASTVSLSFRELCAETEVRVSSEELFLPLEIALPCGLVVNELLSNCLKHAFPDQERCREPGRTARPLVQVSSGRLGDRDGWGFIRVRDNGVGFDLSLAEGEAASVGLMLIRALSSQVGGSVEWRRGGGTEATFLFPLELKDQAGRE